MYMLARSVTKTTASIIDAGCSLQFRLKFLHIRCSGTQGMQEERHRGHPE